MPATITRTFGPQVNVSELCAVIAGAFAAVACLANALVG